MGGHIQQINIDITINATYDNIKMQKVKLEVNNKSHSAALKKIESLKKRLQGSYRSSSNTWKGCS